MSHLKMSKTLVVTGLASVLLFTSACSGDGEASPTASASASVSATDAPTTGSTANGEYGPTIEGMPTLKELAKDKNGVWRKTTILPDDPAFEIKEVVLDSMEPNVKEMWSDAEIQEANALAVKMVADMIDTSANGALGDTESMEKWWETNKANFDPEFHEELYNDALSVDVNKPLVYKVSHRQHDDLALDYSLVYGEDKVHIKNREIFATEITAGEMSGKNAIAITLQVGFVNVAEVDGKEVNENSVGNIRYTFIKDGGQKKVFLRGN